MFTVQSSHQLTNGFCQWGICQESCIYNGGHLLGDVLTAKHLKKIAFRFNGDVIQGIVCTEGEDIVLKMQNFAEKSDTLCHKTRQKAYLLKPQHLDIQELQLPAVSLYTVYNFS